MKGRVLFLTHEYPPVGGGASPVCERLAKAYVADGLEVEVITMAIGGKDQIDYHDGVKVVRLSVGRGTLFKATSWSLLRYVWRSYRYAIRSHKATNATVIHAHFAIPAGISAWLLNQKFGLPYVLSLHGSDVLGYRNTLRLGYRLLSPLWKKVITTARSVVVPSNYLAKWVEQSLGATIETIRVIPHGIDIPTDVSSARKEDFVLTSGRLIKLKRVDKIVRGVALNSTLPLVVVGAGEERGRLESLANFLKANIKFTGWMDNRSADYHELFAKAKFYVAMSERESFGMTALEAMAQGCVVIVAPGTALAEVVGEAGVVLKDSAEATLAHALMELKQDEKRTWRLANLARQKASEYSWLEIIPQYKALL